MEQKIGGKGGTQIDLLKDCGTTFWFLVTKIWVQRNETLPSVEQITGTLRPRNKKNSSRGTKKLTRRNKTWVNAQQTMSKVGT
jgi:hypothetical protein